MDKRRTWTEEEVSLLIEKYPTTVKKELELLFNHSPHSITTKAVKLGLHKIPQIRGKTYSYDAKFFHNINSISSFYAGFIAGDGCIRETPRKHCISYQITIDLALKDEIILSSFKHALQSTSSILYSNNKLNNKIYPQCSLRITGCENLVKDLTTNFNVTKDKSKILNPPNLDWDNSLNYISGFIEADGSIYTARYRKYLDIGIQIYGLYDILSWTKNIFEKIINEKTANVIKHGNIFSYNIHGRKAYILLKYLESKVYKVLMRKWNNILIYEQSPDYQRIFNKNKFYQFF